MVKEIFNNCDQQEQGLRSCLGLVSLERKYTSKRLEAAYSRAVSYQACYYKSLKSFLQKGLDILSTAESLKSCQWIELNQNILISGPTGTGKTYLACAFGSEVAKLAARAKTRYVRLTRLLQDLSMVRGESNIIKFLDKLQKTDLLILDDWGHKKLTPPECRDLLEFIDDRNKCSIITASQLPLEKWYASLENHTMADAILDRLIHNAHIFVIAKDSMCKVKNSIVIQDDL